MTSQLYCYYTNCLSTLLRKTSSENFVKRKTNHGITNVHFWFPFGRQLFIENNNHKTNQGRSVLESQVTPPLNLPLISFACQFFVDLQSLMALSIFAIDAVYVSLLYIAAFSSYLHDWVNRIFLILINFQPGCLLWAKDTDHVMNLTKLWVYNWSLKGYNSRCILSISLSHSKRSDIGGWVGVPSHTTDMGRLPNNN